MNNRGNCPFLLRFRFLFQSYRLISGPNSKTKKFCFFMIEINYDRVKKKPPEPKDFQSNHSHYLGFLFTLLNIP
jgi:hypothetical protein